MTLKCFVGENCSGDAFVLAPQESETRHTESGDEVTDRQTFVFKNHRFIYLPVCKAHANGWWEGTDLIRSWRPPMLLITKPTDSLLIAHGIKA